MIFNRRKQGKQRERKQEAQIKEMSRAECHPEGMTENSPTFQGWVDARQELISPEGTTEPCSSSPAVPLGLAPVHPPHLMLKHATGLAGVRMFSGNPVRGDLFIKDARPNTQFLFSARARPRSCCRRNRFRARAENKKIIWKGSRFYKQATPNGVC